MNKTFEQDIKKGLSSSPKYIPSQYFYDETGDQLFQQIMKLEEYYLPRIELEIIGSCSHEIFQALAFDAIDIIELGAGDGSKTLKLLKNLKSKGLNFRYIPLDISSNVLEINQSAIQNHLPDVDILPIAGDYMKTFSELSRQKNPKLVMFLGSNLGNFTPDKALGFIKHLYQHMNGSDALLMGIDLKKNPQMIAAAYNDSQQITRMFNLNLLGRINRELGADFKLNRFDHYPFYDPIKGSAFSYLVSLETQKVKLADGTCFYFEKNELIHTEVSYKYSLKEIEKMGMKAGFLKVRHFTDPQEYFTLSLFQNE
jgi:L-histidine Nalpha-methyltransferase